MNNAQRLKVDFRGEVQSTRVPDATKGLGMLPQSIFLRMLDLERKRMERSQRRFVLMLLDPGRLVADGGGNAIERVISALARSTRETDLKGWYRDGQTMGVIFTEIGDADEKFIVKRLSAKVTEALYETLSVSQINEIRLSFHTFPEDWDDDSPGGPASSTLHVDLVTMTSQRNAALLLKRAIDITGSLVILALCLPVLIAVAIAVKLTSKGDILFRQTRLGQYGRKFTFLKFRSMYTSNDQSIHEQYVKRFIAGEQGTEQVVDGRTQYKLTADPRITPVGNFLRKTSLDELPQLINVLRGDMSLVGPRPPLLYEFTSYSLWHKRRLLAVKPGITGLWQVEGRSRTKFDDMVRLDLRYARSWSLWLDIKILLKTPRAVFSGSGAC
jgi:exopolysaccharide biosynthesis polyprenyl glycosylphosphotransferase